MTLAAKAAGFEYVELVYEPQSAAAYNMHAIEDGMHQHVKLGDVLLVADLGGGTGDFVSYEFCDEGSAGAKVRLKTIGEATGALCGSEFITREFLKWLGEEATKEVGSLANMLEELGLSEVAFRRTAAERFEGFKVGFSTPIADSDWVPINGAQGARRGLWYKEVTSQQMTRFFAPVVQMVIDHINMQMTPRTNTIIISGGFGNSTYLLDRIRGHFPHLKIMEPITGSLDSDEPVSRGALLRYKDIQTRSLTTSDSFGIGTMEVYDADTHPDATYLPGATMANGRRSRIAQPNYDDWVDKDQHDNDIDVVYERWAPILKKGGNGNLRRIANTTSTWRYHLVKLSQKTLTLQVYWTELDLKKHAPMLTMKSWDEPGVNLLPGIEKWDKPLEMRLPSLRRLNFEVKDSDVGPV